MQWDRLIPGRWRLSGEHVGWGQGIRPICFLQTRVASKQPSEPAANQQAKSHLWQRQRKQWKTDWTKEIAVSRLKYNICVFAPSNWVTFLQNSGQFPCFVFIVIDFPFQNIQTLFKNSQTFVFTFLRKQHCWLTGLNTLPSLFPPSRNFSGGVRIKLGRLDRSQKWFNPVIMAYLLQLPVFPGHAEKSGSYVMSKMSRLCQKWAALSQPQAQGAKTGDMWVNSSIQVWKAAGKTIKKSKGKVGLIFQFRL